MAWVSTSHVKRLLAACLVVLALSPLSPHAQTTTQYDYDALGRLIGVKDQAGGLISRPLIYDYDNAGNRIRIKNGLDSREVPAVFTASSTNPMTSGLTSGLADLRVSSLESIHVTSGTGEAWVMADLGATDIVIDSIDVAAAVMPASGWSETQLNGAELQYQDANGWHTETTLSDVQANGYRRIGVNAQAARYWRLRKTSGPLAIGEFRFFVGASTSASIGGDEASSTPELYRRVAPYNSITFRPVDLAHGGLAPYTFSIADITQGDPVLGVVGPDPQHPGEIYYLAHAQLGVDEFTFGVTDANNVKRWTRVQVTIAEGGGSNRRPTAIRDVVTTDAQVPITFNPVTNDADIDDDPIHLVSVQSSQVARVTWTGDQVTYEPAFWYSGIEELQYTIADDEGATETGYIQITVEPAPPGGRPPSAYNDTRQVTLNTALTFDPLVNDIDLDGDAISIVSVTPPSHGAVIINAGHTLTYSPTTGYLGADALTYTITDGAGHASSASVSLTVSSQANRAPAAAPDNVTLEFENRRNIDVLLNDTDADGDDLIVTSVTNGQGTAQILNLPSHPQVDYTPGPNFIGTDTFTYTASDRRGGTAVGTVTVTVGAPAEGILSPTLVDDQVTTMSNTAITFDPRVNDVPADSHPVEVFSVTAPAHGAAIVNNQATITYTPAAGYSGQDTFNYNGRRRQATVTVTVSPNQAPTAVADSVTTPTTSGAFSFDPRTNDTDPEGNSLKVASVTTPGHGQAAVIAAGDGVSYTADPAYTGVDSFNYTITDGFGGTATATITVTVPNNTAPVANGDTVSAASNVVLTLDPRTNDTDLNGDALTVTTVGAPSHGSTSLSSGVVRYRSLAGYTGADSFSYTISDARGATATATVSVTVFAQRSFSISPAVNGKTTWNLDTDGSLALPAAGSWTIIPSATFQAPVKAWGAAGGPTAFADLGAWGGAGGFAGGVATFDGGSSYRLTVASGGGSGYHGGQPGGGYVTSPTYAGGGGGYSAVLSLTDNVVVLIAGGGGGAGWGGYGGAGGGATGGPGAAAHGGAGGAPGTQTTGASESDQYIAATGGGDYGGGGGGGYHGASGGTSGAEGGGGGGGGSSYTHPSRVTSGVLSAGTWYQPAEATDPDRGSAGASMTIFGGQSGPGKVVLVGSTIGGTNSTPVAANDAQNARSGAASSFDPRLNDSDPDLDNLTVSAVGTPGHGSAVIISGGAGVTYTPTAGYSGSDSFSYTIGDGRGGTASATVNVTVAANVAPVAVTDTVTATANVAKVFDPRTNDTDAESDALTITAVGTPSHGAGSIVNSAGAISYTATAGYAGSDSFSYTINDGHGGTASGTINVTVVSNTAPSAVNDGLSATAGTAKMFDPRLNDGDADGDTLTITAIAAPAHGVATIVNNGGAISYTATAGYAGTDSFAYTIDDGRGATATATINMTVVLPGGAIDYLVVAGGGGGGSGYGGGGGGGGGVLAASTTVSSATYAVTVGAAVSGATQGNNSTLSGSGLFVTALGGGLGGAAYGGAGTVGGSGGGGANYSGSGGAAGTSGQGYSGANSTTAANQWGGGGGGGGGAGDGKNGGVGFSSNISGATLQYGGGGGGGAITGVGAGGSGGGGDGGLNGALPGSGANGRGGGGGGEGNFPGSGARGGGGSGVVIIRYLTGSASATGGTITTVGAYTIHTFTGNGSFVIGGFPSSNTPPVASADTTATSPSTAKTLDPRTNDYDPDGDSLTVSAVGTPSHGTVSIVSGGGSVTYTPTTGYVGSDSFGYTINDGHGGTASATVSVLVQSLTNHAPTAANDTLTTRVAAAASLDPRLNDSDEDSDSITVSAVTTPSHGSTAIISSGAGVTYTPTAGYSGSDSFSYTISDGRGMTASATVNVTVAANAAPVAVTDTVSASANVAKVFDPRTNDTDAESDALTITAVGTPSHGSATIVSGGGAISYTATVGYAGSDSFSYTIDDSHGGTATGTVNLTVVTNVAPTAANDNLNALAGTAKVFDPRLNDSDADGDTLTITVVTTPSHGAASIVNSAGAISYTATAGYTGADSFSYTLSDGRGGSSTATVNMTVSVASTSVDYLIVAGGGGGGSGVGGGGGGGGLLSGSTTISSASNAIVVGSGGSGGAAGNGSAAATNGGNTTALGLTSIGGGAGGNYGGAGAVGGSGGGRSYAGTGSGGAGTSGQGNAGGGVPASGAASGGGGAGSAGQTSGAGGAATSSSISGTATSYAGGGGGGGQEDYSYGGAGGANAGSGTQGPGATATANRGGGGAGGGYNSGDGYAAGGAGGSGVVVIRYLTGATTGTGGTITTSGGYTIHTFTTSGTFAVSGGGGSSNTPPVPSADTTVTSPSTAKTLDPRTNDYDPDGDSLTVSAVGTPSHGTVSIVSGGGSVTYTPTTGYVGSDSFGYTISDGHGGTASASVSMLVQSLTNHAPAAANDTLTTRAGAAASLDPRLNDSDEDSDPITVSAVTTPSHGSTVIISSGAGVTYTPMAGYSGSDSFSYTISDGRGMTASATVNVTVAANVAPVAITDTVSATANVAKVFDPRTNDTDAENDALTITAVGTPSHGSATIVSSGGAISYTATIGYAGSDSFSYTIDDGHGGTATGSINMTVVANAAPVAANDNLNATAGTAKVFDPRLNDSDADGDTLTITAVTTPSHGAASIVNSAGAISYTATAGYTGADSFDYTISDGRGGTASATVNMSVAVAVTWSPTDKHADLTLSNGNLTASRTGSGGGSYVSGRATTTRSTGKAYFEVTVGGAVGQMSVGVANLGASPLNNSTTWGADGANFYAHDSSLRFNGSYLLPAVGYISAGSTVRVAIDLDTRSIWIGTVGSDWNNSPTANPATGVGGLSIAALSGPMTPSYMIYSAGGPTWQLNAGGSAFVGALPAGFTSWSGGSSNTPPVASADTTATSPSTAKTLDPRTNDYDPDGDSLTVSAVGTPGHGTVSIVSGGGSVTYTPTTGYVGSDSFGYTISDGHGGTASATVSVLVQSLTNHAPTAANDTLTTRVGAAASLDPRLNDSDEDSDPITVSAVTTPSHGSTVIISSGAGVTYAPTAGYSGSDSFSYTISDGRGMTASATVNVTVAANAAPVAVTDTVSASANVAKVFDPRTNDTDAESDALTITAVGTPSHGSATIVSSGGAISYTATVGYAGSDSFSYTIDDSHGGTATGTVNLTVSIANASVEYLLVGGGGGGGNATINGGAGGGGGGGVLTGSVTVTGGSSLNIVVGAGGAAGSTAKGGDTVGFGLTAYGGGPGRNPHAVYSGDGGSGGGPGSWYSLSSPAATGTGISGQGYSSAPGMSPTYLGSGGGGASAAGSGQNGGQGLSSSISGAAVIYGSGGGGGGLDGTGGGNGGANAGNGAITNGSSGVAATANRGGGGGGGGRFNGGPGYYDGTSGGGGGSGIAIIRYATGTMSATGGTVTTSGGYTIHTFTANGVFVAQ